MGYTTKKGCCPPQGRELLPLVKSSHTSSLALLSPAGARAVTVYAIEDKVIELESCCPPQGRELLPGVDYTAEDVQGLLFPAGARAVTTSCSMQ